ncbi:hypothetical protein Tco_0308221 [Tanacetum coccineum]
MLDTYTTSMFMESWGWSNFARTMSDLHAHVELKDTLVVAVSKFKIMDIYSILFELNMSGKRLNVQLVSENDVEDDDNETASFMASKSSKGIGSLKTRGEAGKMSLYERWKDDYGDNPYDEDEECEDLTEDQLAFYDAFDISLRCQIRRWLCFV